jgi:hypothetical protein
MKILSTLIFVLLFTTAATAQFKQIAEGPVFKEPEDGLCKIIQMKSGNVAYLRITIKDGIDVKIYDVSHKSKADQHLEPAYGKLKAGSIEACFAIKDDVILLISEVDDHVPVLYRLVIDGNTGQLKEEKTIAKLNKTNMGQGYAAAFGGVPIPDFFIRKDPYSDNYALVMLNSFESDRNKRIEIVFYGDNNQEVSRAYYASPDNKYKYLQDIDMAVIGDQKVVVLAKAYNTNSSGGKENELVLASLDAGASAVTLDELKFTQNRIIDIGLVRYNPVTKKLILLAAERESKKSDKYSSFITYIDPFTRKLEKTDDAYANKANELSLQYFGRKEEYTGMPQNLSINHDGSFSIVYEEVKNTYNSYMSGGGGYDMAFLGNVAVTTFDKNGKVINDYFVPKYQKLVKAYMGPFYLSYREGTAQLMQGGNQYKSFSYLSGSTKNYILFNDIEENGESAKRGKLTTIWGVGDCDGFYFDANGTTSMPDRKYVFGEPGKHEHNLALFSISDYNSETNMYVTLKLAKGKEKGVSVVWLQPQ